MNSSVINCPILVCVFQSVCSHPGRSVSRCREADTDTVHRRRDRSHTLRAHTHTLCTRKHRCRDREETPGAGLSCSEDQTFVTLASIEVWLCAVLAGEPGESLLKAEVAASVHVFNTLSSQCCSPGSKRPPWGPSQLRGVLLEPGSAARVQTGS